MPFIKFQDENENAMELNGICLYLVVKRIHYTTALFNWNVHNTLPELKFAYFQNISSSIK